MRILWASNAPYVGSGYGVQTEQVVRRLQRDGHSVAIAANYGLQGTSLDRAGIPIFPNLLDMYGNDAVPYFHAKWKAMGGGEPTLLMTLFDVWVYKEPAFEQIPTAAWVPVDHFPAPPEVAAWCRRPNVHPIAMSQFGRRELDRLGIGGSYVPHAVETSVFKPTPSDFRKVLNIPEDAFLVVINAANKGNMPPRKAWGEMLQAFALLAADHPDAYLYLHTDLFGSNGVPIPVLLQALGIEGRTRFVPQLPYRANEFGPEQLAAMYSAGDVLLATSFGEGFGVPVIEAQACGLPVIVNNVTAQPELCGAGWTVSSQPYWDYTQGQTFFGIPMIADIHAKLEAAYAARGDQSLRDKAVAFAQGYEAETVYQRDWVPLIADLERWITGDPPTRQQRRAAARKGRKAA